MSFLWCPTLTGEQPIRAQKAAIRIGDYDREIMTPEARRTGETASTSRSALQKLCRLMGSPHYVVVVVMLSPVLRDRVNVGFCRCQRNISKRCAYPDRPYG
jgi:hypothetical protein